MDIMAVRHHSISVFGSDVATHGTVFGMFAKHTERSYWYGKVECVWQLRIVFHILNQSFQSIKFVTMRTFIASVCHSATTQHSWTQNKIQIIEIDLALEY